MSGSNRVLISAPLKIEPKAPPLSTTQKSVKSSSTVIARVVPPTSAPRTTSLRKTRIDRKCEQCHAPLDLASIVESCQIIDEKLICGRCLRKNNAARKLRVYFHATIGIVALTAVVFAVALPQAMLLVLLPTGAILTLSGILATNSSSVLRLAFVAGGLGAIVGSFAGTHFMKEHAQARQNHDAFEKQTEAVHTLIDKNQYVEAQNQVQYLESSLRDRSGQLPPEAGAKIGTLKQHLDEWVRMRFGELNPQEKSILSGLMSSFPDAKNAASNRFRSVKFQDNCIAIGATVQPETPCDGPAPSALQDPAAGQARGLALLMFSNYPAVKRVDIELFSDGADAHSVGTFTFDRENATALRMGSAIGAPPGIQK